MGSINEAQRAKKNSSLILKMDANSPEAWFKNLPVVTRGLLVTMFSTTCLAVLGLLDPHWILLDWSLVTRKYEGRCICIHFRR